MTFKELNDRKLVIANIKTGSRAYKLDDEKSDFDYFGIFAYPLDDLWKDLPSKVLNGDDCYWEIGQFARDLVRGDVHAIEMVTTPVENYLYSSYVFAKIRNHAKDFITKATLSNWIQTASLYFSVACKTAKLALTSVSVLDYLYYIPTSVMYKKNPVRTLSSVIAQNRGWDLSMSWALKVKAERIGLADYDVKHGLYSVFDSYESNVSIRLLDDKGDIYLNQIEDEPSSMSLKGYAYFDKRKYERDKRLRKLAVNTKIINGYCTKSMMHAFRVLYTVHNALRYGSFLTELPEKAELMDIKRGLKPLEDLKAKFFAVREGLQGTLEIYKGSEAVSEELVSELVSDCRNYVKIKKPTETSCV